MLSGVHCSFQVQLNFFSKARTSSSYIEKLQMAIGVVVTLQAASGQSGILFCLKLHFVVGRRVNTTCQSTLGTSSNSWTHK